MTAHRWMVFMPFEVTPQDARRVATGKGMPAGIARQPDTQLAGDEAPAPDDPRPFFGLHNVVRDLASVGCYVCEQPYSDEVAAKPCPGDPGGADLRLPASRLDPGAVSQAVGVTSVGRNDPCPCGSGQKFKRLSWQPVGSRADRRAPARARSGLGSRRARR